MIEQILNILHEYEKDKSNLDEECLLKVHTLCPYLKNNIQKVENISFFTYEYDVIEFYELLYEELQKVQWGQILYVVIRDRLKDEYKKVMNLQREIASLVTNNIMNNTDILTLYRVVEKMSNLGYCSHNSCKILERISSIYAKHKVIER